MALHLLGGPWQTEDWSVEDGMRCGLTTENSFLLKKHDAGLVVS